MLAKDVRQIPIGQDKVYITVVVNCEVDLSADFGELLQRKYSGDPGESGKFLVICLSC